MPTDTGYGLSFMPGADDPQQQQGEAASPLQSAIKLLSLRLPTVTGARGIAPQGLLHGQGAGGLMGNQSLMAWLQQVLSGGMAGGAPGMAPTPKVTPGIDDPARRGGRVPAPEAVFNQEEFLKRVPGGGFGNTGRPMQREPAGDMNAMISSLMGRMGG
jgi:hypothetical protein